MTTPNPHGMGEEFSRGKGVLLTEQGEYDDIG